MFTPIIPSVEQIIKSKADRQNKKPIIATSKEKAIKYLNLSSKMNNIYKSKTL